MDIMLLRCTSDPEALAGQAAATCTKSSNWASALRYAIQSGHESVAEHVSFTFLVSGVSRSMLAQLTRHRIATFSVQSQRYVDLGSMETVMPKSIQENPVCRKLWESIMDEISEAYRAFVDAGIPLEDARYITPQAVQTEIMFTMNARELLHFFSLRCCNRAQWEIRQMADQMLKLCKEYCPTIFQNAGPGCVRGSCPEKRPCGHPRGPALKGEQE